MDPITLALIASTVAGLGGSALKFLGGKKAANQDANSIGEWQMLRQALAQERSQIENLRAVDAWNRGTVGRNALTQYLSSMPAASGAARTPPPTVAAPGAPAGATPEQAAAYQTGQARTVAQANRTLASNQAGMDRQALGRELARRRFSAFLPVTAQQPQAARNNYLFNRQLADIDARANQVDARRGAFRPSNTSANLDLAGGTLQGLGSLGMQFIARMPSGGGGGASATEWA